MKTNETKVNAKPIDMYALSAVVGSAAALMMFGQQGACIGKTFNLTARNGKTVIVTMTTNGARIDSALTRAQLKAMSDVADDTVENENE